MGIADTPFSRYVFSSAPLMLTVNATLPNGSTPSTEPRVIGYGGGVNAGQTSSGRFAVGQVRSARRPPEFVIAKSKRPDAGS